VRKGEEEKDKEERKKHDADREEESSSSGALDQAISLSFVCCGKERPLRDYLLGGEKCCIESLTIARLRKGLFRALKDECASPLLRN
jgi:hypothetical protein